MDTGCREEILENRGEEAEEDAGKEETPSV